MRHYWLWRWGQGDGAWAKACEWPPEAGKDRETDSPPEGTQLCQYPDFSPGKPISDCDFQNCKRIKLCCFKALSLWSFGIAAIEKGYKPLSASSLSSLFSRPQLTFKVHDRAGQQVVQALAERRSINTGLYYPGAKGHCAFIRLEPDVTETEPGASESQLPRTPRAWRRSRSYDLSNKHSLRFPPLLRTKRCRPDQIHLGKTRPSAGI